MTNFFLGLAISAFGDGIRAPLLVVASSYIDQCTETARLYTWFAFTDALSHTLGDPFLQSIWRLGLHLQGRWLTLPILVTLVRYTDSPGQGGLICFTTLT